MLLSLAALTSYSNTSFYVFEYKPLLRPSICPEEYWNIIEWECFLQDVPVYLYVSLVYAESEFKPNAKGYNAPSDTWDLGICQFNDRYIPEFSRLYNNNVLFDPFNPKEAIPVSVKLIKDLYRQLGCWDKAIMGYNCGPYRVEKNTVPEMTKNYLTKIHRIKYTIYTDLVEYRYDLYKLY